MIEVHNLRKSFGAVVALNGVSFTAPDGQITGLLGPNGAGKTTTLRIICTVLNPDSGTVRVDGHDVRTAGLKVRERIGVLPDGAGLYPRLTARENILYYGRLHGLKREEMDRNIETMVDVLDMHEIIDRRTEGFSHGERLKVAIARALVHRPQNVLLDEPTNGLDVISTRAMRGFILRLREEGRTVVFSSHIMQEVSALCDNIVVIARGQVVAAGTPDELRRQTGFDNLEDAFVAALGTAEGLQR